ncbi:MULTISPECIES: hypothetical protein [unclassified Streptomyces]|uniref:hypothetical protein n=1 Tax=unclassified Streptomyces TaxID=2593676 RepID=UPI002E2B2287|nr:hypothetical protein [Streptomyces sp. NBC_00223]
MTGLHWHTSVATGTALPLAVPAVSPLVVREWVFRPRGVYAATFDRPEDALSWLGVTLDGIAPMPGDLSPDDRIAYAREHLALHPPQAGEPTYSASGYLVQDLVACRVDHDVYRSSLPVREKRFAPHG